MCAKLWLFKVMDVQSSRGSFKWIQDTTGVFSGSMDKCDIDLGIGN